MRTSQIANKRGLTLTEIVIALAILAIALAGIIGAIVNSMTASALNRQLNMARDAAFQKLDEVRGRTYANVGPSASPPTYAPQPPLDPPTTYPPAADGSVFEVGGLPAPPGMPAAWIGGFGQVFLDESTSVHVKTVRVVVRWQSEAGVRTFQTSSIITR